MLVRPRCVAARPMYYAEDGVGADKVPGIDRRATGFRIADEPLRVDRLDAAIGQTGAWSATIQLALIEIDALFILGAGTRGCCARRAWTGSYSIARGLRRRIERAIVRNVV